MQKGGKKKAADSDDERESEGDFIDENDIIVFPDDLDQHLKGNRLDYIGKL